MALSSHMSGVYITPELLSTENELCLGNLRCEQLRLDRKE